MELRRASWARLRVPTCATTGTQPLSLSLSLNRSLSLSTHTLFLSFSTTLSFFLPLLRLAFGFSPRQQLRASKSVACLISSAVALSARRRWAPVAAATWPEDRVESTRIVSGWRRAAPRACASDGAAATTCPSPSPRSCSHRATFSTSRAASAQWSPACRAPRWTASPVPPRAGSGAPRRR